MVHLGPCSCPAGKMARVRRAGWMRAVFPGRARYDCGTCGRSFLASAAEQAELGVRAFAERTDPEAGQGEGPGPG